MHNEGMVEAGEASRRRRFARLPVALPAIGHAPAWKGEKLCGTVWNIGAGGIMAEFPVEVALGSAIRLVLQTRRGPVEVEGLVVWTAGAGSQIRHGLAFQEPKGREFALDVFFGENR